MADSAFIVDQIDHVEFFVPDRRRAAAWYDEVLGFKILPECEHWAEHPHGPLMISSDAGRTKLALFEGQPQLARATAGFHRVAFVVDAVNFDRFLGLLRELNLTDGEGRAVTRADVKDHSGAYSIYFCDPYGHRLEITTYDYARASELLRHGHR